MNELEIQFTELMMNIYRRSVSEAHYTPSIFLRMLGERGAIATAQYLLNEPKVSEGFVALYERGRLDLTVESQLLSNPQFWELFTEQELDTARRWLAEYQNPQQ